METDLLYTLIDKGKAAEDSKDYISALNYFRQAFESLNKKCSTNIEYNSSSCQINITVKYCKLLIATNRLLQPNEWQAVHTLVSSTLDKHAPLMKNNNNEKNSDECFNIKILQLLFYSGLCAIQLGHIDLAKNILTEGKNLVVTSQHLNNEKNNIEDALSGLIASRFGHMYNVETWDILLNNVNQKIQLNKPLRTQKDWASIEKELDKELQEDETEISKEESLEKLLRNIYQNADDDTRRAMIRSYQTSGGTVLSTNWAEVSRPDNNKDTFLNS